MDMGRKFNARLERAKSAAEKKRMVTSDAKLISDLLGSNKTLKGIAANKLTSLSKEEQTRIVGKIREIERDRFDEELIADMLSGETAKKGAAVERLNGLSPEDQQRIIGKLKY